MKKQEKFKTTNLDLACVLVSEGYSCVTRKMGPVSAEFVFDKTGRIEDVAEDFRKGKCTANITTFMYARFALKRELAMKAIEWEKARPGKLILNPGEFYYYIADDGKAYRNVFANRDPHIKRVLDGNAFRTLEEANVAARNVKVD